jgi:hypothetical protein
VVINAPLRAYPGSGSISEAEGAEHDNRAGGDASCCQAFVEEDSADESGEDDARFS